MKGKESFDCVNILYGIGLVYDKQGKPKQALKYYLRALNIYIKEKKEESLECANIFNNIGIIYKNQNNLN